jgi:hypothetical protein
VRRPLLFLLLLTVAAHASSDWRAAPAAAAPADSAAADSAKPPRKAPADTARAPKKSASKKSAAKRDTTAAKSAPERAAASKPLDRETRGLLFRKQWLETHLALAKEGKPYMMLDTDTGELTVLVRNVVLARFPAEGVLPGIGVERLVDGRAPGSILTKPFRWTGFEKSATAEAVEALTVTFDPPLRIDFRTSPSDFAWLRLRSKIVERLPWTKKGEGLSITLFHAPASLVAVAPVLSDSLPLLISADNASE